MDELHVTARSVRKTLSELLRLWFENYSVQAVVLELAPFVFLFSDFQFSK